jgi:hypothetical protein
LIVIPTTAISTSRMIWATAKSTDVNSRHRPCPRRARTSGPDERVEAAGTTAGVAMADL